MKQIKIHNVNFFNTFLTFHFGKNWYFYVKPLSFNAFKTF